MKYVWDEHKNRENIRKHHIDFKDAMELFDGDYLDSFDHRHSLNEDRFKAIGYIRNIPIVLIYSTHGNETIRIISARKAKKHEEKNYWNKLGTS